MEFDPIKLAERFDHQIVHSSEAMLKHKGVRDALLACAQSLFPDINLPQDAEDVTRLLSVAGQIVHNAIDAVHPNIPDPPAGYTEVPPSTPAPPSAGAEAPGGTGEPQAVDGAAGPPPVAPPAE